MTSSATIPTTKDTDSTAGYTPGPWIAYKTHAVDTSGLSVAEVGTVGRLSFDALANVHLISAAPDMYEALKAFVAEVEGTFPFASLPGAIAAIAKAEGKS